MWYQVGRKKKAIAMMIYTTSNCAPSSQLLSPSRAMSAAIRAPPTRAISSNWLKISVSGLPISKLAKTRRGATKRAIWRLEPKEMARGNPEDLGYGALIAAGIASFILEFVLFDFAHEFVFSVAMVAMPLLILIVYLLYATRLIHGGADAKAIMTLAVMFPLYPDYTWLGIRSVMDTDLSLYLMKLVFPFAVTALFNSVFAFVFAPFVFMAINAYRRDWGGGKTFFGYRTDVARLADPNYFVWLLETPERRTSLPEARVIPGRSSIMALHDVEPASQIRWFRKAGMDSAWVTPKIPFIIPIFFGTLIGALVGNVFFYLFLLMLGG